MRRNSASAKPGRGALNSRTIAFWRFDTSGVGTFDMISNTTGQYSRPIPLQYPKVGTTNSAVRVGTIDVASGATRWIGLTGDPRQNYVPQMSWAGTSRQGVPAICQPAAEHLSPAARRSRQRDDDAAVRRTRRRLGRGERRSDWLDGGKRFTWLSERDGWRHLYVASSDGKTPRPAHPRQVRRRRACSSSTRRGAGRVSPPRPTIRRSATSTAPR